jgi:prevent-host-death family protein
MLQAPQVEPISKLRRDHVGVMEKLKKGPVFLAQRGTLSAALVSIEEWDRTAKRLQELEWREEAHRAAKEAGENSAEDMSYAQFMAILRVWHKDSIS